MNNVILVISCLAWSLFDSVIWYW